MAIKDILVHLEAGDAGASASGFALSLAGQLGAHLTAAGVAIEYIPPSTVDDAGSYEAFANLTEESRKAVEAAYQTFVAAAPSGVETELVMIEALAQIARDRFGELGRHFDFSIVGQGSPEFGDEAGLMAQGSLYNSGNPVFVVPFIHKGPAKLGKAMVCWDGGIPAARAISGAIPLLQRAGSVEIVQVIDEGQAPEELPGFNIARHLARHGVNTTVRKLPPANDIGAAMLSHVADSGADFMVMGAYGHWKLTEFVFGGVTRTILKAMTVPIFMAH
jgi:nucleotide-binding universal stress UspA family protein